MGRYMKINFTIWHLIMALIVALLGYTFFEIAETIVFRSANIFLPENISQWIAIAVGVTCSIVGYKKIFKRQLEKVCRENFLAYRINFYTFLLCTRQK